MHEALRSEGHAVVTVSEVQHGVDVILRYLKSEPGHRADTGTRRREEARLLGWGGEGRPQV